jgi:hypothetical protein
VKFFGQRIFRHLGGLPIQGQFLIGGMGRGIVNADAEPTTETQVAIAAEITANFLLIGIFMMTASFKQWKNLRWEGNALPFLLFTKLCKRNAENKLNTLITDKQQ